MSELGPSGAAQVCAGPPFLEGPVWCPGPEAGGGSLVVTDVAPGRLHRVDVATGAVTVLAETAGGANGAAPAADGGFLVAQNGGLDFAAIGVFDDPPVTTPTRAGLQHVGSDGTVTAVTREPLQAPNDLFVAPDGTVYFTDPPSYPLPPGIVGRIMALGTDGTLRVVADGFWYPNGIGMGADGLLLVVENGPRHDRSQAGLVRILPDGSRERIVARSGDGFCFDVDGRIYLAGGIWGITVLDPDGTVVDLLELPGNGMTSNCCFGGPDGRTLFATSVRPGGVWAWEGMPTPGAPLVPWPGCPA